MVHGPFAFANRFFSVCSRPWGGKWRPAPPVQDTMLCVKACDLALIVTLLTVLLAWLVDQILPIVKQSPRYPVCFGVAQLLYCPTVLLLFLLCWCPLSLLLVVRCAHTTTSHSFTRTRLRSHHSSSFAHTIHTYQTDTLSSFWNPFA